MTMPDERWDAALSAVGATATGRDEAYASLAAAYRTGNRHYHVLAHASDVVDAVLALHSDGDDWGPVVIAAWYHDAIHDPLAGPGVNEGSSAVLAERALAALRVANSAIGEVVRLVCVTAGHDVNDGDRTGALLCDADLSILGADAEDYDAYAAQIRSEYAHVDDVSWVAGRRRVLRSFLDRPSIFRTPAGRERWESRARINISTELQALA